MDTSLCKLTCKPWVHLDTGGMCGVEHTHPHTLTQLHTHEHTLCVELWHVETDLKLRVYDLVWLIEEG